MRACACAANLRNIARSGRDLLQRHRSNRHELERFCHSPAQPDSDLPSHPGGGHFLAHRMTKKDERILLTFMDYKRNL